MSPPRPLHDGFLPGRHTIAWIGQGGFRFGEMSHQGSILSLPSGIRRWDPPSPFRHDDVIYSAVFQEEGVIDMLLIGTGTVPLPMPEALCRRFREMKMAPDVMTTASAASTYNLLLGEGRRVAAALVAVA
jgi:uncharacterized protein